MPPPGSQGRSKGKASSARRWSPTGAAQVAARLDRAGRVAVGVDDRHRELDLGEPAAGGEGGGDPLGRLREQYVVGIENEEDLAAAALEAGVQRRSLSALLLQHYLDPVLEAIQDIARLIRGAVVDDDDMDLGMGLRAGALDRLAAEIGRSCDW